MRPLGSLSGPPLGRHYIGAARAIQITHLGLSPFLPSGSSQQGGREIMCKQKYQECQAYPGVTGSSIPRGSKSGTRKWQETEVLLGTWAPVPSPQPSTAVPATRLALSSWLPWGLCGWTSPCCLPSIPPSAQSITFCLQPSSDSFPWLDAKPI